MKAALVTMNVKAGECDENFSYMKKQIQRAREDHADMIIFPQNAISGYLLGDMWLDDAWCRYVETFNEKLIQESENIAIIWGNIRYRNHRRFNAAFFAYQKMTHMRVKRNENRPFMNDFDYFEDNPINSAIPFGEEEIFALNFQDEIQIADMNINIDAHPYAKDHMRKARGNVIYVNACGMQNQNSCYSLMEGGSYVLRNGKCLYHAPFFQESYAIVDLDLEEERAIPQVNLFDALCMGIRAYDTQIGKEKCAWILPCDHLFESTLCAGIVKQCVDDDRIYLCRLYKDDQERNHVQSIADKLHVQFIGSELLPYIHGIQGNETCDEDFALANSVFLNQIRRKLDGVIVLSLRKAELALEQSTGDIAIFGDLYADELMHLFEQLVKDKDTEAYMMELWNQDKESDILHFCDCDEIFVSLKRGMGIKDLQPSMQGVFQTFIEKADDERKKGSMLTPCFCFHKYGLFSRNKTKFHR